MSSRRALADLEVLSYFLEARGETRYGLEIARALGLKSGTLYPVLARLERDRVLCSHWEAADPSEEGRPRLGLYLLTERGERVAHEGRTELWERMRFDQVPPLVKLPLLLPRGGAS